MGVGRDSSPWIQADFYGRGALEELLRRSAPSQPDFDLGQHAGLFWLHRSDVAVASDILLCAKWLSNACVKVRFVEILFPKRWPYEDTSNQSANQEVARPRHLTTEPFPN